MDCTRAVLIVEDDESIRELVSKILNLAGYRTITAANGQEAINLITQGKEAPCIILLDLMMPIMDGWSFVETIERRNLAVEVPIVVISAADMNQPTPSKAVCRMKKPLNIDDLYEVVGQYCEAVS